MNCVKSAEDVQMSGWALFSFFFKLVQYFIELFAPRKPPRRTDANVISGALTEVSNRGRRRREEGLGGGIYCS